MVTGILNSTKVMWRVVEVENLMLPPAAEELVEELTEREEEGWTYAVEPVGDFARVAVFDETGERVPVWLREWRDIIKRRKSAIAVGAL